MLCQHHVKMKTWLAHIYLHKNGRNSALSAAQWVSEAWWYTLLFGLGQNKFSKLQIQTVPEDPGSSKTVMVSLEDWHHTTSIALCCSEKLQTLTTPLNSHVLAVWCLGIKRDCQYETCKQTDQHVDILQKEEEWGEPCKHNNRPSMVTSFSFEFCLKFYNLSKTNKERNRNKEIQTGHNFQSFAGRNCTNILNHYHDLSTSHNTLRFNHT